MRQIRRTIAGVRMLRTLRYGCHAWEDEKTGRLAFYLDFRTGPPWVQWRCELYGEPYPDKGASRRTIQEYIEELDREGKLP